MTEERKLPRLSTPYNGLTPPFEDEDDDEHEDDCAGRKNDVR
jgi:hypothetical protein